MYPLVYGLISTCAKPLLRFVRIFHSKLDLFFEARASAQPVAPSKRKYWIHCASLGEYEMAIPVIQDLLLTCTLDDILITFFSPSGYEQAKHKSFSQSCMYLPLDTPAAVKGFYKNYQPDFALFIRYDLWYNFINTGLQKGVQFFLVNARFQANHKLFSSLGKPYKRILKKFNTVFCSDESTAQRLRQEGFTNAIFTGDIRFDRVHRNSKDIKPMPDIEHFVQDKKLLVLGSSWEEEEVLLQQLLERIGDQIKVIIAPHDVREERILSIENRFSNYSIQRYTRHSFGEDQQILIFDSIGILSQVYQYADFALVGGGFSGKLHNILEPAVFGCFISFGPKISKFPEAELFIQNDFGYAIHDTETWINKIQELVQDEEHLNTYHQKARNFVIKNLGANQMILDQLNKL